MALTRQHPSALLPRALGALLVALGSATALAACGSSASATAGSAPASGTTRASASAAPASSGSGAAHRVDSGLDYLHAATGIASRAGASLLGSPAEVQAYPQRFEKSGEPELAADLRARLPGGSYPPSGQKLVAVTAVTGCARPQRAELWAQGSDLSVHWTADSTPKECLAPYKTVAVFRVPVSSLPQNLTVEGQKPEPAGSGG